MIELPQPRDLVGGVWAAASEDLGFDLEDPATGEPVGRARGTSPARLERALATAEAFHAGTARAPAAAGPFGTARGPATTGPTGPHSPAMPPPPGPGRALTPDVLDAIADALDGRLAEITALEAFATGVPITQTAPLGMIVSGSFRLAAAQLRAGALFRVVDGVEVHRLPLGPALCLVPWNAPAPMAAHKVASALAAGCPVVLKVSELAPYGSQVLAEVVAEHVPEGMFQFVHGGRETGAALVADPRIRVISFTGGLRGGQAVAAASAPLMRPLQLELGGNNPLLVLPGADLDTAARMAAELLTTLNGQWCRALGRLIVPRAMKRDLVEAVGARLSSLRAGPPLDPATELGPLVHSAHRARIGRAVGGLPASSYGEVPGRGNFLAPMLVDADLPEEVFGPVAGVLAYDDVAEAIGLANAVPYGLEGYVCGPDQEAALAVARLIRAGEVKVNGSSIMSLHLMTPRPAWGLSGLGEEGTAETLRLFTGARVVGVEGRFALHTSR